jgi:hypothetical protein
MESSKTWKLSLSPVGSARISLTSVLQPGYYMSPDSQPSSLCWRSALPPIRVFRIFWPYERFRVKSLSFRKLQKKAKISCRYCPRLKSTALTFTFQVGSIISEQTFRTLQCLGLYCCNRHCTAVAIIYIFGLQKIRSHLWIFQTDRKYRKLILLTPMHKTQMNFVQIHFWLKQSCYFS